MFFQDEGRFGRINNLSRCWVPKGIRAIVGKQITRQYTYAYASASPETGETFSLILPYSDTDCMSIYLQEMSKYFINYRMVIAMDQAGWHTTNKLTIPENIVIWKLPPRSPELNPAEHIWEYIREQKKFNNQTFDSIQHVEDSLTIALEELSHEKEIIKSMTNFNWFYLHS